MTLVLIPVSCHVHIFKLIYIYLWTSLFNDPQTNFYIVFMALLFFANKLTSLT